MSTTIINSPTDSELYGFLTKIDKIRVSDGQKIPILSGCQSTNYTLMLVLPQLGDFDSLEYAWWLNRQANSSNMATQKIMDNLNIKAIAIGNLESGKKFCEYTQFPEANLFIDEQASIHQQLNLYQGLNWYLPRFSATQNAWLNLLLMCAGIGSKGTLKEVFRGYLGDKNAPQLFTEDEQIRIKPLPSISSSLFQKAGQNYQRPFELATLRLQNMTEVLNNWRTYVPDDRYITQRGGTFLFNPQGELIYQHRDKGILGFAKNMSNPLDFLNQKVILNFD